MTSLACLLTVAFVALALASLEVAKVAEIVL